MIPIHCTLKFHRSKMSELSTFAKGVAHGIYENPTVFVNPPITPPDFAALNDAFSEALASYKTFGKTKKTIYANSKNDLMVALDTLAHYVTDCAQGDASIIVLAGFTPSISNQQRNDAVTKVDHFILKREEPGIIIVEIPPITDRGSIHYFCICSEGRELAPDFFMEGTLKMASLDHVVYFSFSKPRFKTFTGLTPTVYYYFYVFVANATSVSPLSEARKMMVV